MQRVRVHQTSFENGLDLRIVCDIWFLFLVERENVSPVSVSFWSSEPALFVFAVDEYTLLFRFAYFYLLLGVAPAGLRSGDRS